MLQISKSACLTLKKLVFKYFSWHSVDRSYVGIWFVLNRGVIISEAVTLSR